MAIIHYYDAKFEQKIPTDKQNNPIIDLGKTMMNSTNSITIFLKNEFGRPTDIMIQDPKDKDLRIYRSILKLEPGEAKPVQITFHPDFDREKPLNTFLDVEVNIG